MKKIYLSRHAKKQMKWRQIFAEEVREALNCPDKIEESRQNRKNAYKHINDKLLRVTYREEADRIVVITVVNKNK